MVHRHHSPVLIHFYIFLNIFLNPITIQLQTFSIFHANASSQSFTAVAALAPLSAFAAAFDHHRRPPPMLLGIGIFAFANPVPADQHHHHQQQQQQGRFPSGGGSSSSAFHHQQHHVNGTGTRVCLGYADVFIAFILASSFINPLPLRPTFLFFVHRLFLSWPLCSATCSSCCPSSCTSGCAHSRIFCSHRWPPPTCWSVC